MLWMPCIVGHHGFTLSASHIVYDPSCCQYITVKVMVLHGSCSDVLPQLCGGCDLGQQISPVSALLPPSGALVQMSDPVQGTLEGLQWVQSSQELLCAC